MGWIVGADLAAHRAATAGFLTSDPVGRTGQATLLAALAAGVRWSDVPPVYAIHRGVHGEVDGCALRTPPHPLQFDGHADLAGLVVALAADDPDFPSVNAPEPTALVFAAAWTAHHRAVVRERDRLHLLALPGPGALRPPGGDVRARQATAADTERVVDLVTAMRAEIGETGPLIRRILTDRIAAGVLWVVDGDDGPVATANASAPVAGVSRVAGVYTAPAHRGRGLAAVATAAVTLAAYGAGAEHVCLFTDAANPVSNGVYERLGFVRRPVDRLVLVFDPA